MPIFDFVCMHCGSTNEVLLIGDSEKNPKIKVCETCGEHMPLDRKLPGAPSFRVKGLRAANGYGLKFTDSYGKSNTDGHESGYSYTSNKAETVDHNQGQKERKV